MGGRELSEASARSRVLAVALEPVVGSVYFAPEAHEAYAALGFGPSPGPVAGVVEGTEGSLKGPGPAAREPASAARDGCSRARTSPGRRPSGSRTRARRS